MLELLPLLHFGDCIARELNRRSHALQASALLTELRRHPSFSSIAPCFPFAFPSFAFLFILLISAKRQIHTAFDLYLNLASLVAPMLWDGFLEVTSTPRPRRPLPPPEDRTIAASEALFSSRCPTNNFEVKLRSTPHYHHGRQGQRHCSQGSPVLADKVPHLVWTGGGPVRYAQHHLGYNQVLPCCGLP